MILLNTLSTCDQNSIAVVSKNQHYTYQELIQSVNQFVTWLNQHAIKSVCINLPNCYEWVVIDIACQAADIVCTPIPQFFSKEQVNHLIDITKPDVEIGCINNSTGNFKQIPSLNVQAVFHNQQSHAVMPKSTNKVTFTSGSTGHPKGVCLSIKNQMTVANSLVSAINIEKPTHLVLLPLTTLLENIAGVYSPLLSGGSVNIPSDEEKGFSGSRLINLQQLLTCISANSPETMILVPELLQALMIGCDNGWKPPSSLKFIAVGGAKVDSALVEKSRQYGLPVFQGYGLSECGSVVSICTNKSDPADSVGTLLHHITISKNSEQLVVKGNCFLGYLEQPNSWYPSTVNTGDIVKVVGSHLYIEGREKHLIINSFGRNISPEWIESKITATGKFRQNIIVGDAKPYLCALLVPISAKMTRQEIQSLIDSINNALPDYAKILAYIILTDAFSVSNGLCTQNGKIKRKAIENCYQTQINNQYLQHKNTTI